MEPFIKEYKRSLDSNNLIDSFKKALEKAKKGMESTKDMVSRVGRSSRLLERSRGHLDVGAVSSFLILESFYDYLKEIVEASE